MQVFLVDLQPLRCNSLLKCVSQHKIAKNSRKPPILRVQGHSKSSTLTFLKSSLPVLVMINSTSVQFAIACFHWGFLEFMKIARNWPFSLLSCQTLDQWQLSRLRRQSSRQGKAFVVRCHHWQLPCPVRQHPKPIKLITHKTLHCTAEKIKHKLLHHNCTPNVSPIWSHKLHPSIQILGVTAHPPRCI